MLYFAFLIILLTILQYSLSEIVIDSSKEQNNEIISYAIDIFNREKYYSATTLIIYTEPDSLVNEFYKRISIQPLKMNILSVKLDNLTYYVNETSSNFRPDLTIAFLQEEHKIEEFLYGIDEEPIFFCRSRFLIIINKIEDEDDGWIEEGFQEFWTRQAIRVIICFWQEKWRFFSYNPYKEEFAIDITDDKMNLPEIYSDRLRNMNNQNIKLFHFDNIYMDRLDQVEKFGKMMWVGMDGIFLDAVSKYVKGSIDIFNLSKAFPESVINSVSRDLPINDYFETLWSVYDFDAICNAAGILPNMDDMDHVWHDERDDYFVMTPVSKQIPRYLYIFLSIPLNIWYSTFLSLIAVSIATYIARKYTKNDDYPRMALLDNYGLLVGQSMTERDQDTKKRLIIVSWLIFCLIFTTLFQSILTTTMVSPLFYPNIETFQDLYKTNIRIWIIGLIHILLMKNIEKDSLQILEHLDEVPPLLTFYGFHKDWMDEFLYKHDEGMVVSQEQIYYVRGRPDLNPYFHVMKNSLLPYVRGYYVRPNKILFPEFVEAYALIQQAGLYVYWKKYNYGIANKNRNLTKLATDEESDEQVLTLEHLQLGFVILLLGLAIAFVCFLMEIFIFYCCGRTKQSKKQFLE